MDGLLIVDKPAGPTSHDVVARLRRALREKQIGHTGTLDPLATGVLVLVIGKATRLAKFLSASDKSYEAVIRFGFATDTADAQGQPIGEVSERRASREAIDAALDEFRGTFLQQPPAFSAKKIDGQRSYKLARAARAKGGHAGPPLQVADAPRTAHLATPGPPALPAPVSVTAHAIRILSVDGDHVTLRVDCSAGFYIRSLAHDLGQRLGIGAHLAALRRTRSGGFGLDRAVALDLAERDPGALTSALVPLADMLPSWPSVVLTDEGVRRVGHGQDIRPIDQLSALSSQRSGEPSAVTPQPFVRLLDPRGDLLGIAEPTPGGALHPSVVLM
jgi:tRNA pseudouridine55 synthase